MAQIKALDQFYQNQLSKSVEKCGIVQKIDLKVGHHPQNPKIFWNFFLNSLRINRFGSQGSSSIILRDCRLISVNLELNEWLKIEKIVFYENFFGH